MSDLQNQNLDVGQENNVTEKPVIDPSNPELRRIIDSEISKAVNTYKEGNYQKDIQAALEKALKEKETLSPEELKFKEYQTQLQELQEKIKQSELSEAKLKNQSLIREKFKEAEMPEMLIDFIVSEDETKSLTNAEMAIKQLSLFKQEIKKNILSANNIKVPEDGDISVVGTSMKRVDFEMLPYPEKMKAIKDKVKITD